MVKNAKKWVKMKHDFWNFLKMKRIQNEDVKYKPTSGQNIILGWKSHMGPIQTLKATVRLFKTEKHVKMAKNSNFCLLLSLSMGRLYQICVQLVL